jgi:predicted O-methyltransferase YrrM
MNKRLSFKQKLYFALFYRFRLRHWVNYFGAERAEQEKNTPQINLQQRNIQNLKTLASRADLIEIMPRNKVVAEIGVDHGDFSEIILKATSPAKLHLIDAWAEGTRYHIGLKNLVEDKFRNEILNDVVKLDIGYSTDVLKEFEDAYFDWVYLDTDHSYQTTKAELAILKSKVKPDGIIAGHDYTIGNWVGGFRYGVIEAVNEFCVNEDWEMIFLTAETDQYRSFAIKKINT